MEPIDYVEAGRRAYDCWMASHDNMPPEQPNVDKAPVVSQVVQAARQGQSRRVAEPEMPKEDVTTESVEHFDWDNLSKPERKRWVDIAIAVTAYVQMPHVNVE